MTADKQAKAAGLDGGLARMVELTDVPRSTLVDWSNKQPERFKRILELCVTYEAFLKISKLLRH